ncbi:hypothetical protein VSR69_45620, partial [Paraburkholderia phytofirmans]
GGNNRATALSLNACPYFANSFSHHRPRVIDSIGATSILTRGGSVSVFRRVFTDRMGMTPGQWRRLAREREWRRFVCGITHE